MSSDEYSKACAEMPAGDRNYCVPVTIGLLLGVSPALVDAQLRARGARRPRSGVMVGKWTKYLQDDLHIPLHRLSAPDVRTTITAERHLKSGRYLLKFRGHVAALIDGKVHDWTAGRRHKIQAIYPNPHQCIGQARERIRSGEV